MARIRVRNYMFTMFNYDKDKHTALWESHHPSHIQYLIGQLETCPTTGHIHFQGYVEFSSAIGLNRVKELLGDDSIHLDMRKGTQDQAIAYVTKTASQIQGSSYILGNKKVQGQRNDIAAGLEELRAGKSIEEIIEERPSLLRLDRHLERQQARMIRPRAWETNVKVLIGEPGSGKTRYVHDNHKDVYVVPEASSGTQYFDGYIGQETVLIDDFNGNIRYNLLLQLTDRYPMRVNTKGGYVQWAPKTIYITSNYEIDEWYQQDCTALRRRIAMVQRCGTEVAGNTIPPQSESGALSLVPHPGAAPASPPLRARWGPHEGPPTPPFFEEPKKNILTNILTRDVVISSNSDSHSREKTSLGTSNTTKNTIIDNISFSHVNPRRTGRITKCITRLTINRHRNFWLKKHRNWSSKRPTNSMRVLI